MWEKITAAVGFVLTCIMAALLGKSYAQRKESEKEARQAEERRKAEAEAVKKAEARRKAVQEMKQEIFNDAEDKKQKLNTGDSVSRFNAANDILRHRAGDGEDNP